MFMTPGGALAAADTESQDGGDCWQQGTPLWCRDTWQGRNQYIYFRAINDYSSGASNGNNGIQAAVNAWNSAPGPQFYSFSATSNDTWIYLHDSYSGQHDLDDSTAGITWNCQSNGYCSDSFQSMEVDWSDIYGNHDSLDQGLSEEGDIAVQNVFAHESGHAMGLAHSGDENDLMFPGTNMAGGPSSADIGTYPGCSSGGAGLRCIYGQGN